MTADQQISVRVTRRFDAPPERVFDGWLDEAVIEKWMIAADEAAAASPDIDKPRDEVLHIKTDPRVGGSFSFAVRRAGHEIDHIGEYLEIDRPRRLAFTWGIRQEPGDTSRVILDIEPLDSGCELTLTHEMGAEWADYADRTKQAWATILGGVAAALDSSEKGDG